VRTHSRKQIRQIGDSIQTFGFTNSILIDSQNTDQTRVCQRLQRAVFEIAASTYVDRKIIQETRFCTR
jgi:hypothetical protein